MKKLKGSAGFSLIEVVAATAVIGMLAAMVIPSLNGVYEKAHKAKITNDLATIDSAIVLYKMDNGSLPSNFEDLVDEYLSDNTELGNETKGYTYKKIDNQKYTLKYINTNDNEEVLSNGSAEDQD